MRVFVEIAPMKAFLEQHRSSGFSIGFVPTMGALHAGHLALVKASAAENRLTICSIYVNPAQFNNPQDLERYPRTLEKDLQLLEGTGVDAVFCPNDKEMYGETKVLNFNFGHLEKILEGEFRPGHFNGVGLVVSKLFNIIQPNRAYFGQKDFQQFKIISTLVEDLKFDIALRCVPTVREPDGLAMSSRNVRLDAASRQRSATLYRILRQSRDRLLKGEAFNAIKKDMESLAHAAHLKLEYLAMVSRKTFLALENTGEREDVILLIAAHAGDVRLIDNVFLVE